MRTRAGLVVVVALVLVAGFAGAGTALATPGERIDPSTPTSLPEQTAGTDIDPDTVLLTVDLESDGTASWTIEYRVLLDDGNTTDAFESVAEDIRTDPAQFREQFRNRMERTAAAGENRTGREMAIQNVTVETTRQELGQEYGVIRYQFTWTNFAVTNETTIRAGDAISGFFLDSETQLLIGWPEGYRAVSITPNATERRNSAAVWRGRLDFGPDSPRVVVTNRTDPGGSTAGGTSLLVAAAVVVLLVGVGLLVARQRGLLGDESDRVAPTDAGDSGPTAETASDPPTEGAAAAASESADESEASDDGPPEELLTPEERILKLLEESGGRIKQKQVAEELDWTDAKTSQVVKRLREDDEIEVFRLGRENVLSHPDEDDI